MFRKLLSLITVFRYVCLGLVLAINLCVAMSPAGDTKQSAIHPAEHEWWNNLNVPYDNIYFLVQHDQMHEKLSRLIERVKSAIDAKYSSAEQRKKEFDRFINARSVFGSKNTLLRIAAFKSATKSIEVLLKAGADVNQGNEIGSTPLMAATRIASYNAGYDPDIIRSITTLLLYGADRDIKVVDPDCLDDKARTVYELIPCGNSYAQETLTALELDQKYIGLIPRRKAELVQSRERLQVALGAILISDVLNIVKSYIDVDFTLDDAFKILEAEAASVTEPVQQESNPQAGCCVIL